MKLPMRSSIMVLMCIIVFVLNGCTKPKDGVPGPAGAKGNANVQNTSITIHPSDWLYDNVYKQWYYNYICSANSSSAVLGYVISGNGSQALPYVDGPSNSRYTIASDLFQLPAYIQFQFVNFTTATVAPSSDQYFNLVIIPPALILLHHDLDFKNYTEVRKTFNL